MDKMFLKGLGLTVGYITRSNASTPLIIFYVFFSIFSLIAYNDSLTSYSKEEVHKTITTVSGTADWWHYLPNVYLLESTSNHNNIANAIIKKHPGLLFFIVRVDLSENNGVLNKDAWEWITSKSPKKGIRL